MNVKENAAVSPDVCSVCRTDILHRIDTSYDDLHAIHVEIRDIREMQQKLLYVILGMFASLILSLLGIILRG